MCAINAIANEDVMIVEILGARRSVAVSACRTGVVLALKGALFYNVLRVKYGAEKVKIYFSIT